MCAPEAESSTIYWLFQVEGYLTYVFVNFLINKSKANRVDIKSKFFIQAEHLLHCSINLALGSTIIQIHERQSPISPID